MKRILFLLLLISGTAYGQFAPTSAKTAFKNGISLGTRDSAAYNSADSLAVVINRQGRMMYRSTDGFWKLLANVGTGDFVPYTGATQNVTIGNFRVSARTLLGDSIMARGSGGVSVYANNGTQVALFGAGGGSGTTLYGGLNGTTGTFSGDLVVNGITVGEGAGSVAGNTLVGSLAFENNTSGTSNSVFGFGALRSNTTGTSNTAIGVNTLNASVAGVFNTAVGANAMQNNTSDSNTAVGRGSLLVLTTGRNNTAIGVQSGARSGSSSLRNTTGSNNTYVGANTVGSANNNTNETVIGFDAIGNGSNTVTIGNSSVTDNYFSGNVRATNIIASGYGAFGGGTPSSGNNIQSLNGHISTYHNINADAAGYGLLFYTDNGGSKGVIAGVVPSGVGTTNSGRLLLSTTKSGTASTKVTINEDGLMGVGTTTPATFVDIKGGNGNQLLLNNAGERFTQLTYQNNGTTKASTYLDNTNNFLEINTSAASSTIRAVAVSNGVELATSATSWSAISDERFKIIDKPIDSAVNKIMGYRSVIGRYKTDSSDVERAFLIAQDVQKTFPYAVTVGKDSLNTLRLSYTELIPLLIKATQEQQVIIEALKKRIELLEKR